MRRLSISSAALLVVLALAGCAEAVHGPRVVPYTPDRFYIRHVPVIDSRADMAALAGMICAERGGEARLEQAAQYLWLDVRDVTFRCVGVATAPDPSDPAFLPHSG